MKKNHKKIPSTSMYQGNKKGSMIISFLVLAPAIFFVYYPSLVNDFIRNWDDPSYIIGNDSIKEFSFKNLQKIFSTFFLGNYHPLTLLSFSFDYFFFKLNPYGYHFVNILIHIFNSFLLFLIVRKIYKSIKIALLSSLLFGIHPIHVESVTWISGRKDMLFCLFFFLSLLLYIYYIKKEPNPKFYFLTLLFFIISCLSKAMAVTLPLVLFLIDYLMGRKFSLKILYEKIPFFIISLFIGILAILAQQSSGSIKVSVNYNIWERLLFSSAGIFIYFKNLFLPYQLSAFYDYPPIVDGKLPLLVYFSPVFVLLLFGILVYSFLKKHKSLFFSIAFFFSTVFIVLQILPVGDALLADRYVYIPSAGIFLLFGIGFKRLKRFESESMRLFLILFYFVFIFYYGFMGYLTHERCKIWKNSFTLFNDVILKNPKTAFAYNNRGVEYYFAGDLTSAIADFDKAIELIPDFTLAIHYRGMTHSKLKQYDLALLDFNKTLQLRPDLHDAYFNRGVVYYLTGDKEKAQSDFDKSLELKPDYTEALNSKGVLLIDQKKYPEALTYFQKTQKTNPYFKEVYLNLAVTYHNMSQWDSAMTYYQKCLVMDYDKKMIYNNMSLLFYSKGDTAMGNYYRKIKD